MDEDGCLDVQRVFAGIQEELGPRFSWVMLLAHVMYVRRKPVVVEEVPLPIGVTAICIACQDVDLIITRTGLSPTRTMFARLHECSHLLLGHVAPSQVHYRQSLREAGVPLQLQRHVTTAYDDPLEFAAETLATQLAAAVQRKDAQLPATTQMMYGYQVEE